MILSTFDKELYEKDLKEEAYEEGYGEGYGIGANDKLHELVVRQLRRGKTENQIAENFGEPIEVIKRIVDEWNHK